MFRTKKLDTSVFDNIATIVETIWGTFFGWMPIALQVAFGSVFAICIVYLGLRVVALVLDAVPFA